MKMAYYAGGGKNPPFSIEDFYKTYPQFCNLIENDVTHMYLKFADSCIKEKQWRGAWKIGMCLFIAHFLTLYLKTYIDGDVTASKVISSGELKGLKSSKAVDGVSVSYDFSTAIQGVNDWAGWTLTEYGLQLVSLAKLYGKGAAFVL